MLSVTSQVCVVIVLYFGGQRDGHQAIQPQRSQSGNSPPSLPTWPFSRQVSCHGLSIGAIQRGYLAKGRIFEIIDTEPTGPRHPPSYPGPTPKGMEYESKTSPYLSRSRHARIEGGDPGHRARETVGIGADRSEKAPSYSSWPVHMTHRQGRLPVRN